MVSFTTSASPTAATAAVHEDAYIQEDAPALPTDTKGAILVARSGPVPGLQDCPVMLPDLLPHLHMAWNKAAAAAAAAAEAAEAQAKQMHSKRGLTGRFGISSNGLGAGRADSGTGQDADYSAHAVNAVARSSSSFTGIGNKAGGTALWRDTTTGRLGDGQRGAAGSSGPPLGPHTSKFYRQSLDSSKARQQRKQQAVFEMGFKR